MKMQILTIKDLIKKNKIVWICFILLMIIRIILVLVQPTLYSNIDYLSLMVTPGIKLDTINILYVIFQIIFLIYMVYIIYTFELNNSFQNIILRYKSRTWILGKMIVLLIGVSIFKLLNVLIITTIFYSKIVLDINLFWKVIFYSLLLTLIEVTLINVFKNRKILWLIILGFIVCVLYFHFSVILSLILIISLFIFNLILFNLKKFLG